mmetsp:Transcript_25050/g.40195  ORF Transcript_25050/g.40195 Transcript_25050/m.40195 type:complete len:100 (-) Transcript_25050:409-708(-)
MGRVRTSPPSNSVPTPPPAVYGRWNLEDHGSARRRAWGVVLLGFSVVCFTAATCAARRSLTMPPSVSDLFYPLLVAATLPAAIGAVYLNWLAVSFFKTA